MNAFDQKLNEIGCYPLKAEKIGMLLILLTFKCNLRCAHCYLEASPDRSEEMSRDTMDKVLDVLERHEQIGTIELTGGEPELNPDFRYFVKSASGMGRKVTIASNLAVFSEPGMEGVPEFLAEHRVKVFGSLPHYTEEIMEKQRGKGTYKKVISALKQLNELGYGKAGSPLELDIEHNPLKTSFALDHDILENAYRYELMEKYGIIFNNLIALNNAPVGRTRRILSEDQFNGYMKELEGKFNPDIAKSGNMMCKYMISVSPEGELYDCAFFRKLDLPLKNGRMGIDDFDYEALSSREIVTNPICLFCTYGTGVSCFETSDFA